MIFFKKNKHKSTYEKSDSGRMFGWWLCLNGERIADINYWWLDISSQFWCQYKVFPFNKKFDSLGYDCDKWSAEGITLESRYAEGYHTSLFIMHHLQDNLINIRSAFVPEDIFLEITKNG